MPRIPDWMRDNFRRGIELHEEGRSGAVVPQTVREARQGAEQGDLPNNKPRRMVGWFARHMVDLDGAPKRGEAGYPTRGQVAHLLWGGGTTTRESERAMRWAERTAARIEREQEASMQLQAVPGGGVLPDGYRPATSEDVPEGRACGNCAFYDESRLQETEDGAVEVWCQLWAAFVRGDHYCNLWRSDQEDDMATTLRGKKDEDEIELDGNDEDEVMADGEVIEIVDDDMLSLPTRALIVVATEGEVTADGRMADIGGLSWRQPPLSLTVNHDPNQRVGRLDRIVRVSSLDNLSFEEIEEITDDGVGPYIVATATLNLDTDLGREVAGEIRDGFLTGVSMEIGDEVIEYDDQGIMHLVEGRIGAVSVVVFQAIESARVVEVASAHVWELPTSRLSSETLVASSIPDVPPAYWFADPCLEQPTAIVVTDEGYVFGHLATWGTCHTGRPENVCVTAPESRSGYAYFCTGYVSALSEDGPVDIPVGCITMDTGHASVAPNVSAQAAAAHYDNTGTAVADVAAGEDEFGIWLAGALRPGVDAEQIRKLRGASLSGDWRSIRGGLELVAALAVNVPGFPVPRVAAGLAASGQQTALVAAGADLEDCWDDSTDDELLDRVRRLEHLVSVLGLQAAAVEHLSSRIR